MHIPMLVVVTALIASSTTFAAPTVRPTQEWIIELDTSAPDTSVAQAQDAVMQWFQTNGLASLNAAGESAATSIAIGASFNALTMPAAGGEQDMAALDALGAVKSVSVATEWGIFGAQANAPVGLDRIDGVRDGVFNFPDNAQGRGVDVFVIDSGLDTNHQQFTGRATAFDLTGNRNGSATTTDPNGHGSHVSGIIGGTVSGVAKQVNLIGMQVFDASGRGSNAAILQALQQVSNRVKQNGNRPSVVNMSLGGPRTSADGAFQRAIESLTQQGIVVVAAAGNSAQDACTVSPAFIPSVITVAASNTTNEQLATFSNFGSCVSIIAPGVDVASVRAGSRDAVTNKSGTSMASPFVAGVMAALMSTGLNAQDARNQLLNSAQKGVMGGNLRNTTNTFLVLNGGGNAGQNHGQNRNGTVNGGQNRNGTVNGGQNRNGNGTANGGGRQGGC